VRATLASGLDAGIRTIEPSDNAQRRDDNAVERMRQRLHIGSAVCELPPLNPLVEGLLFTPGESVIYSPPKIGKTFCTLDLALSVATGCSFMGRPVSQGPVLYVAAEGVGGLGARVRAWQRHHGVENIDATAFLAVAVNLLDPSEIEAVIELAREMGAVLDVIDTLARCAPGADENSAKDMGQIVQAIDRIRDATGHVCVVHHAGKDTTKGMRGSTALLGAVDTVIELARAEGGIKVAVTAQKDAEPPEPWICRLVSVEDSAVIVATRPALGDEERERVRRGAVKQTMVKLIGATPGIGRSKLLRSGLGVRPDTARHLLDELIADGRIVDDEPGLRIRDTVTPRDTDVTPRSRGRHRSTSTRRKKWPDVRAEAAEIERRFDETLMSESGESSGDEASEEKALAQKVAPERRANRRSGRTYRHVWARRLPWLDALQATSTVALWPRPLIPCLSPRSSAASPSTGRRRLSGNLMTCWSKS
jgi:hypothetical protein